jgi:hypothetical protein
MQGERKELRKKMRTYSNALLMAIYSKVSKPDFASPIATDGICLFLEQLRFPMRQHRNMALFSKAYQSGESWTRLPSASALHTRTLFQAD